MCGQRGYEMAPPTTCDCSIALLPWLPPQAFPTPVSSLTSPHSVSPQSIAVLTLGLLHNPWTPAPSSYAFQETCISTQHRYGCGKYYFILIPFRLPQISCFTLRLKCFSSDSDNCPSNGIRTQLQLPHPHEGGPSRTNICLPPHPSTQFLHPTELCMVLYIIFHWSGPPLCSQLVFCMYFCVWRCSTDVSVERHVLHIHLLIYPLVLSFLLFLILSLLHSELNIWTYSEVH